jgi:hypothetical protein
MHLKNEFKGQNVEYYSFPTIGNRRAPKRSKQMPLFSLFSDLIPFRVEDKAVIFTVFYTTIYFRPVAFTIKNYI